jgi:hypothetical protein
MIKFVLGILLVIKASIYVIILFALLSSDSRGRYLENVTWICGAFAFLFGMPGIILIKSGKKNLELEKGVINSSFKMIRDVGHIDISALGKEVLFSDCSFFEFHCPHCKVILKCPVCEVGETDSCCRCKMPIEIPSPPIDEIKIRSIILKAQRKGLISSNIEIR